MIFETKRLLVRKLESSDFAAFHEMQSNPNVMRYTGSTPRSADENRGELEKCINQYGQHNNNFWVWAIELKSTNEFVGTCAVVFEINELGYRFLEKHWGHGFGNEISEGLIEHAFAKMNLAKVYAVVDRENRASAKILDRSKLVFVREDYNSEEDCFDRHYELTQEQWKLL